MKTVSSAESITSSESTSEESLTSNESAREESTWSGDSDDIIRSSDISSIISEEEKIKVDHYYII